MNGGIVVKGLGRLRESRFAGLTAMANGDNRLTSTIRP